MKNVFSVIWQTIDSTVQRKQEADKHQFKLTDGKYHTIHTNIKDKQLYR